MGIDGRAWTSQELIKRNFNAFLGQAWFFMGESSVLQVWIKKFFLFATAHNEAGT